jgi:hypothetical protein
VSKEPAQRVNWVWVVHQDEPANQSIEGAAEFKRNRIARNELHIVCGAEVRPRLRPLHGRRRTIYSNHLPGWAYQISGKESDISAAASDIQHPHALRQSSLD